MEKYIGAGDVITLKTNHIAEGHYIPKGTEFEITFVDRGANTPYCCRCLTIPVTLWLKRDQFDVVNSN